METIAYQLTQADLLAAQRLSLVASLRTKRLLRTYILGALICGVGAGVLSWDDGWTAALSAALLGALFWVIFLSLIYVSAYVQMPRRSRRVYAQQKSLQVPKQASWDAESLSLTSARGSYRFEWSDFLRIVENDAAILLFQSDALFNIIPKRALSAEQAASIMRHAPR